MKRIKNNFSQIIEFENLLLAYHKAAKGKRENDYVLQFTSKIEENLLDLQEELTTGRYYPGPYQTFTIYEPKHRLISAAPFRDRIVHHALMNIIEPVIEKMFIFDSYANRIGKGTHKAILRYQTFLRQYPFVLKCDIKKYFASIDHEILKIIIRRKIGDGKTLALIDRIIDGSNPQEEQLDYFPGDNLYTPLERRRGLPLGNLTSQFFANWYLNGFDHYIKEALKCPGYVRYVDDFVLFGTNKGELWHWKQQLEAFLMSLRLRLKPSATMVYHANHDVAFLGQVIYRSYRRIRGENIRRYRRRLRKMLLAKKNPIHLAQSIAGWSGHTCQATTVCLIDQKILKKIS